MTFLRVFLMLTCLLPTMVAAGPVKDPSQSILANEWKALMSPYLMLPDKLASGLNKADDRQERYELYEFVVSQIASGYPMLFYSDPEHPDFWPIFNNVFNQGLPNPDTNYLASPIDSKGIYRISGIRGTTRIADLQQGGGELITQGRMSKEGGGLGTAYGNDSIYDFATGADGRFEVIYSAERPKEYSGEWRKLDSRSTYLIIRQIAYDWVSEKDTRVAIERLDVTTAPRRPHADVLQGRIKQLAEWAQNYVRLSLALMNQGRKKRGLNTFDFTPYSETGFTTQRYVAASYDLAPDEALIVETPVPDCRYWSFQTSTAQWRSINPLYFRSSINGFQAVLDKDGKFRAVISEHDPGVPNWLATGGHNRGEVLARWNECADAPLPKTRQVKVSEVRQQLPVDTPVVTPPEREREMSKLRAALQMRRRW